MENHGLGHARDTQLQNLCLEFNWKYTTIYLAHLPKLANFLGYV